MTKKVPFGLALPKFKPWEREGSEGPWRYGFVASLARLNGLEFEVPEFSIPSRCQQLLSVNSPRRGGLWPLHPLIDIVPLSAAGSIGQESRADVV